MYSSNGHSYIITLFSVCETVIETEKREMERAKDREREVEREKDRKRKCEIEKRSTKTDREIKRKGEGE